MSQALLLHALRKALVSLIWTRDLGCGAEMFQCLECRALGTKQWGLSLFLSQCSQPPHGSEHALGDGAEKSFRLPVLPTSLERARLKGCRVSGAIWKHRAVSAHYVSVLLSSTSLTPVLGI